MFDVSQAQNPQLHEGNICEFTVDLKPPSFDVYAKGAKQEKLRGLDRKDLNENRGKLTFSVVIPGLSQNMCGHLHELTRTIFGFTDGQKRWAVLDDKELILFDEPWGSESKEIRRVQLNDINSVLPETYSWTEIPIDGLRVNYSLGSELFAWGTDDPNEKRQWIFALKQFESIEVSQHI